MKGLLEGLAGAGFFSAALGVFPLAGDLAGFFGVVGIGALYPLCEVAVRRAVAWPVTRPTLRGRMGLGLLLVVLANAPVGASAGPLPRAGPAEVAAPLEEAIVLLHRADERDPLLAAHPAVTALRRFEALPGLVVRAPAWARAALAADGRVASVQPDALGRALTEEAVAMTGAREAARARGLTGKGVRVVVLDTGVERSHPDLDGGVVAEKCFVLGGCAPDGGDTGDEAPETSGHGTHVTGIITGDGHVAPRGVAPDAEVIVVRVFNGQLVGRVSDWVAALDWVLAHHAEWSVRVVNMSLGTDAAWPGDCDAEQPALAEVVARLRAVGVAVFAASGNEARADGMTAPACVAGVLSVGAVYDADLGREPDTGSYSSGCADEHADAGKVVCFSNVSAGLDLLAPGSRIRSSSPGGRAGERRGTSQASPHAAGLAALLFELDPRLGVDALERLLEETGLPTKDAKSAVVAPLVQAEPALEAARRTQCARRAPGEVCELSRACEAAGDAGVACAARLGTCVEGTCVIALPALSPSLPASGCSATASGALLLGAGLALRARRRR